MKLARSFVTLAPLLAGAIPAVLLAATHTGLSVHLTVADSCTIDTEPPAAVSVHCLGNSPNRISRGATASAYRQLVIVEF